MLLAVVSVWTLVVLILVLRDLSGSLSGLMLPALIRVTGGGLDDLVSHCRYI